MSKSIDQARNWMNHTHIPFVNSRNYELSSINLIFGFCVNTIAVCFVFMFRSSFFPKYFFLTWAAIKMNQHKIIRFFSFLTQKSNQFNHSAVGEKEKKEHSDPGPGIWCFHIFWACATFLSCSFCVCIWTVWMQIKRFEWERKKATNFR